MEEGAADDGAAADEEAGVLEVLEPPQAVSPRRAAAVRPTKARAGRFVDNMSFSLFLEPGRWIHSVVGHGLGMVRLHRSRFVSHQLFGGHDGVDGCGLKKFFKAGLFVVALAWLRKQHPTPVLAAGAKAAARGARRRLHRLTLENIRIRMKWVLSRTSTRPAQMPITDHMSSCEVLRTGESARTWLVSIARMWPRERRSCTQ